MARRRSAALKGFACLSLLTLLTACAREGQDEMSWARAALARNDRLEIVAADREGQQFTVRIKGTGELRIVRLDELIAGPALPAAQSSPAAAAAPTATSTSAPESSPRARPGEAAVAADSGLAPAPPAAAAPEVAGGRVLEAGPGYTIRAAAAGAPAAVTRPERPVTSAALERRHEPIVCQGARLLHIDNRNLEFEGDAVSAEDGCEIHITNSHISASGIGVSARAANVHIDNSLIEGNTASIDASQGAQIYASSSRFRGLSRRLDTAAFHDLGGNVWN